MLFFMTNRKKLFLQNLETVTKAGSGTFFEKELSTNFTVTQDPAEVDKWPF